MRRHVNRRSVSASVSALACAAVAAAAGPAEASPIYIPVDARVGYGPGFSPSVTIHLTKSRTINVARPSGSLYGYTSIHVTTTFGRKHELRRFFHPLSFRGANFLWRLEVLAGTTFFIRGLEVFKKGATAKASDFTSGSSLGGPSRALIWARNSGTFRDVSSFHTSWPGSFQRQYALFSFTDPATSQPDYGWLEMSAYMSSRGGPRVTVIAAAYDPSGNPLPAGAGAPIPEPQRLPIALGALALGAIGVREWRKKRNATT